MNTRKFTWTTWILTWLGDHLVKNTPDDRTGAWRIPPM